MWAASYILYRLCLFFKSFSLHIKSSTIYGLSLSSLLYTLQWLWNHQAYITWHHTPTRDKVQHQHVIEITFNWWTISLNIHKLFFTHGLNFACGYEIRSGLRHFLIEIHLHALSDVHNASIYSTMKKKFHKLLRKSCTAICILQKYPLVFYFV